MKNSKLNLTEMKISSFTTSIDQGKEKTMKGGIERLRSFDCPPTQNGLCTFDDICFSRGPGCSDWQVC
ncbi:MAG: pinensin family lanthipeptide [Cyclobacteriaceae bacterium]